MKPLRMYHVIKGKQDVNIGDNIKSILSSKEDFSDYSLLTEDFNTDLFIKDIEGSLKTKEKLDKGLKMYNENVYICSSTGRIYGIIPINKKK